MQQSTFRNFDQEVTEMMLLASAVNEGSMQPKFTYPSASVVDMPGISIITTQVQEEFGANKGQDSC